MDWKTTVAIVTGASTGIGRETALFLARRGATVIGIARTQETSRASARLPTVFRPLRRASADVTDTAAITTTLQRLEDRYGRVDLLVNNAGTGVYKSALRTSAVEFEAILRTNFLGAVACTLAVLPGMVRRRAGHIVNVSSPSAFAPPPGQTAYAASKAALDASRSHCSSRSGAGVRVSIVYQGT